ncbi:MAG: ribbon-helix-helix protein, CopG family [Helicobacteraceae bacterium]|jgi:predicted DNA-binding protein|nr:ribbon-helix-helix protein, CopG family [Helicobacteraceae bacterium]
MTKTFSLAPDLIDRIATLANDLGKKQSQIIKEAIEEYAEMIEDYAIVKRLDRDAEALERGELKTVSLDEMIRDANARLAATVKG